METFNEMMTEHSPMLQELGMNAVVALLILFIGLKISGALTKGFSRVAEQYEYDPTLAKFLANVLYALLAVVVVILALGQLGIETASLIAVLGAAGLAIALSLKESLSNIASGVLLIMFKPFKVGQFVELAGQAGTVVSVDLVMTCLKTPDNKVIFIPNSSVTSSAIINFSKQDTRRVDLVIGVSYQTDLKLAKQAILDVISRVEVVMEDPAPLVAVSALADSSINFNVRVWVPSSEYWPTFYFLNEEIKCEFDAQNIEIPFPQMDVHIKKED